MNFSHRLMNKIDNAIQPMLQMLHEHGDGSVVAIRKINVETETLGGIVMFHDDHVFKQHIDAIPGLYIMVIINGKFSIIGSENNTEEKNLTEMERVAELGLFYMRQFPN